MADIVLGYCWPMSQGDMRGPKPTAARFALAVNVKYLMETYSKGFGVGISASELEQGCGVSAKTIRRIVNPYSDTGPNLETIDQLAAFFRVEAWQLLKAQAALQSNIAVPSTTKSPPAVAKRR